MNDSIGLVVEVITSWPPVSIRNISSELAALVPKLSAPPVALRSDPPNVMRLPAPLIWANEFGVLTLLELRSTNGFAELPVMAPPVLTLKTLPPRVNVLPVALRKEFARLKLEPTPETKAKSLPVVTLLLLNENAGSADVLVNVDPFVAIPLAIDKFRNRLPMLNVLPLVSLKIPPARPTSAGPAVPGLLAVDKSFTSIKLPVVAIVLGVVLV